MCICKQKLKILQTEILFKSMHEWFDQKYFVYNMWRKKIGNGNADKPLQGVILHTII